MLEGAKWITGGEEAHRESRFLLFRRSFYLGEAVSEAHLFCRALPFGEFRINGKVPEDELPFSPLEDCESTVSVRMYDISSLLCRGENVISAVIPPEGSILCEVGGNGESGAYFSCMSDSSWCLCASPALERRTGGNMLYHPDSEPENWDMPGFNDSDWENARITPGPGGLLTEGLATPLTSEQLLLPPKMIFPGEYDVSYPITGKVLFTLAVQPGDCYTVRYALKLGKDKHPAYLPGEDQFIFDKGGTVCLDARFSLRHFQYASLTLRRDKKELPVTKATISAFAMHTALTPSGNFICSDTLLNELHEGIRRATRFSFQSLPTFQPDKGENGRCAIGFALCGETLYNFEVKKAYKKWLQDLTAAQKKDGQIPLFVPPTVKNSAAGSAADGAALLLLPYEYYLFTGDSDLLSFAWLPMKRYMAFLSTQEEDGILHLDEADISRQKGANACPAELPGTALYYRFASVMATCAPLLGESGKLYEEAATRIRLAFRERFLESGRLMTPSQTAIACTLAFHLADENEKPGLLEQLIRIIEQGDYRFDVGMIGLNCLITVLGEAGRTDVLMGMIRHAAEKSGFSSRAFPFPAFGDLDRFFYRYLAGIRPAARSLIIAPCLPDDMDYIRATYRGVLVEIDRTRKHIISDRPFLFLNGAEEYRLPAGDYNFPTV